MNFTAKKTSTERTEIRHQQEQYSIMLDGYKYSVGSIVHNFKDGQEEEWHFYNGMFRPNAFCVYGGTHFASLQEVLDEYTQAFTEAQDKADKTRADIKAHLDPVPLSYRSEHCPESFTVRVSIIRDKRHSKPRVDGQVVSIDLTPAEVLAVLESGTLVLHDFESIPMKWMMYKHLDAFSITCLSGSVVATSSRTGQWQAMYPRGC